MSFLQLFRDYIKKENLFDSNNGLLLAVSGGVDSSVLCELLHQAGFDFEIAHCNFQLRGKESERDEEFVIQLGAKYGKKVLVRRFDTLKYSAEKKISIQVAAREQRYQWFNQWDPEKQNRILTAHHLDDNVETLLMNFFRGTGISGLRAILPRQGRIVRPLLFAKKEEIIQFAKANDLQWVEDGSNETDKYARNYFRHQVIPLVQKIYREGIHNLQDNLERFRDIEELYQQSIRRHKKELYTRIGDEIHIPVLKLKKLIPLRSIVYEIISEFNFTSSQVGELIGLIESETGKYIQSATHRIIKDRNWFIISPVQAGLSHTILIEETDQSVIFENGILNMGVIPFPSTEDRPASQLPAASHFAHLDADQINFPLLLRKWKQGDYFYPLGMRKKKKIGRFFIDNKYSQTQKEKAWILEMNKKIIWIVGSRIDDRFKITPQTKRVLELKVRMT
jgi:tRNA(Ile)-lysidine synthase